CSWADKEESAGRTFLDKALQHNLVVFQAKVDIQLREINDCILKESDRIITALSGWHERINDKGWKSTVEARHFVFALRDYYHGGLHHRQHRNQGDTSPASPASPSGVPASPLTVDSTEATITNSDNGWALDYVKVSFLQSIAEAIDDDGSGFITIREINEFFDMRPVEYSTLEWLAYWAAGWHSSVTQYVDEIYRLLRKFRHLRDKVRYENLGLYDFYLCAGPFNYLHHLLRSTKKASVFIHPELAKIRDQLTKSEEARLVENLEKLSYNLDSEATVTLVTGPHRIERYIYPLLHVLLKRHLQIVQVARLNPLNTAEFVDKIRSIWYVLDVFILRMKELSAVFQQMNVAPKSHFEHYAYGIFHSSYDAKFNEERDDSTLKAWDSLPVEPGENNDVETCPHDISTDILQYVPTDPFEYDQFQAAGDVVNFNCDPDYSAIHGSWSTLLYNNNEDHLQMFYPVILNAPENASGNGSGTGSASSGRFEVKYAFMDTGDDNKDLDILILYPNGYWTRCFGTFNSIANSISGGWYFSSTHYQTPPQTLGAGSASDFHLEMEHHSSHGTFRCYRTPVEFARFLPTPKALAEHPSKARWHFASQSVLFGIRRGKMEKNYVTTVLKDCRRKVELHIKQEAWELTDYPMDQLDADEIQELRDLEIRLSPSTSTFFYRIGNFLAARLLTHL
ncbi:hypothetical protein H0H93_007877, partial [Arthromyces matolae]